MKSQKDITESQRLVLEKLERVKSRRGPPKKEKTENEEQSGIVPELVSPIPIPPDPKNNELNADGAPIVLPDRPKTPNIDETSQRVAELLLDKILSLSSKLEAPDPKQEIEVNEEPTEHTKPKKKRAPKKNSEDTQPKKRTKKNPKKDELIVPIEEKITEDDVSDPFPPSSYESQPTFGWT